VSTLSGLYQSLDRIGQYGRGFLLAGGGRSDLFKSRGVALSWLACRQPQCLAAPAAPSCPKSTCRDAVTGSLCGITDDEVTAQRPPNLINGPVLLSWASVPHISGVSSPGGSFVRFQHLQPSILGLNGKTFVKPRSTQLRTASSSARPYDPTLAIVGERPSSDCRKTPSREWPALDQQSSAT